MCISSIVAISPDLGDDFAIVGDNFMKSCEFSRVPFLTASKNEKEGGGEGIISSSEGPSTEY